MVELICTQKIAFSDDHEKILTSRYGIGIYIYNWSHAFIVVMCFLYKTHTR